MNHFDSKTRKLNLWYPFADLKKEVGMRTAYLGKLRSTEQAQHLLDLIHLTDDEEKLMMSYAQNAMVEVYECISKYARGIHEPTMVFNDGKTNTFKIQTIPCVTSDRTNSINIVPSGNHIKQTLQAVVNEQFETSKYGVLLNATLTYTPAYTISDTMIEIEEEPVIVPLTIKTKFNGNLYEGVIDYTVNLSPETESLSASYIKQASVNLDGVSLYILNPAQITEFSWIEYEDGLWFSMVNVREDEFINMIMDSKNNRNFICYPFDPRYSIRYYINYPVELNVNYILPLDIAIKEVLVCHIIMNWLEYAYPLEAANWHAKYEQAIKNVRCRCHMSEKPIKKLIPRWF